MNELQTNRLLAILYQALHSTYGLLLAVGDVDRAKSALYKARKSALDPELSRLRFREAQSDEGNLYIYKVAAKPQSNGGALADAETRTTDSY